MQTWVRGEGGGLGFGGEGKRAPDSRFWGVGVSGSGVWGLYGLAFLVWCFGFRLLYGPWYIEWDTVRAVLGSGS